MDKKSIRILPTEGSNVNIQHATVISMTIHRKSIRYSSNQFPHDKCLPIRIVDRYLKKLRNVISRGYTAIEPINHLDRIFCSTLK